MPQTQTNFVAIDDPTTALRFDLTGVVAGQHRLWARVRADSDTSLWISADGAQDHDWSIPASTGWEWRLFDAGDVLDLVGGSHNVSLKFRGPNLDIDALVLTKDGSYTPSDLGSLPADGESFFLEAEDGVITGPLETGDPVYLSLQDAPVLSASGGFSITGAVAGQHTLWVRARTPAGADPSLTLDVNGNSSSASIGENTSWTWISMTNADLDLAAGDHDIALSLSGSNGYEVAFDSVILTKDTGFTPTGLGTPPSEGESYLIEAEDFTLNSDFSVQTGDVSTESGGDYIQAAAQSVSGEQYRQMSGTEAARNSVEVVDFQYADYTISSLPDGSGRTLWIRARRSSDSVAGSSLWIRFDDSGDFVYDLDLPPTDTDWHWVALSDDRFETDTVGDVHLRLRLRDAGVDVDQWILTDNSGYSPSGVVNSTPSGDGYRYDLMEAEDGIVTGDLRAVKDLSQIKTGDFLMDLDTDSDDLEVGESYRLNYYSASAAIPLADGTYGTGGANTLNYISCFRETDTNSEGKSREIIRFRENARGREFEFRVTEDEREWELKKGEKYYEKLLKLPSINDLEQSRAQVCGTALNYLGINAAQVSVKDRRLRDSESSNDEVRKDTIELTKNFTFGERVVCEIADPEGRQKKTYNRYYEGITGSGNEEYRGYLKGKERSGGDWETYDYEKVGGRVRKSKVIACFVNTDNAALENEAQVTEYGYDTSSITLSDIDDYKKTVDRVKGVETGRSYYIKRYSEAVGSAIWQTRTITSTVAGAAWNANSNLTRITTWIPEGTAFAGELRSVEHADGRLTLHIYSLETVDPDPNEVGDELDCVLKTTYEGYPSTVVRPLPDMAGGYEEGNIPGTVVKGTKTITYRRIDTDRKYEEKVIDIESGKTLSHYLWTDDPSKSPDPYGRPTMRMNMISGAAQYMQYYAGEGCTACAQDLIGSITDEQGITTVYEYDDQDRREFITRQGVTIWNVYDAAGNILEVRRAPEGTTHLAANFEVIEQNTYDKTGALVSRKVPGPYNNGALVETQWTYEELSEGGEKTTTIYDVGGIASTRIEITAADGKLLEVYGTAVAEPMRYEYGAENGMAFTKTIHLKEDPNASGTYIATNEWTAEYSLMGRRAKTVYADGAEVLYAYDASGRLEEQEDPDGVVSLFAYNNEGERYQSAIDVDQDNVIETGGSDVDRVTETERLVTTRTYDGTTYDVQRSISKVWTNTGLVTTAINDRSLDGYHSWSERFDQVTYSFTTDSNTEDGNWTVTTRNPDNKDDVVTNATGRVGYTVQTYTNGRLTKTEQFDSTASSLASTTYTYDGVGRQATIEDSRTGTTTLAYYDNDALKTTTAPDPDGSLGTLETQYLYDSIGRQTQVIHPDATSTYTVYNDKGQVIKTYGSQQNPVEYTYDYAGRQATMTTWQDFNESTGTGISGDATTTWIYDNQRGWLDRKEYDDGEGTDYTYTPGGRLASRTWARGVVTNYAYNTAGDLFAVDYSDSTPDLRYTYTRTGQQNEVVDGQFPASEFTPGQILASAPTFDTTRYIYDYDYNERFQVEDETVKDLLASDVVLTRIYEDGSETNGLLGRPEGYSLSASSAISAVNYAYDSAGRLHQVSNGSYALINGSYVFTTGNDTFTYGYLDDSRNLLETMTGPVHTTTYSYEPGRNAMTGIENKETVGTATVVSNYAYTYNALGQRADREQSGTAFTATTKDTFSYDYLGQVTASSNDTLTATEWNPSYTYDEIGNRLTAVGEGLSLDPQAPTTYSANAINQYTAIDAVNQAYDLDGNLTDDSTWSYIWNGENRLVEANNYGRDPNANPVESPDANGEIWLSMAYDYQGRLVEKHVRQYIDDAYSEAKEVYLYDGWNRIATCDVQPSTFSLAKRFLWGMDLSGSMQGAGGVGGLLKEGSLYPTYDANGNIVQKLNSSGVATMEVEYDPFGNIISGSLVGDYGFSTKPLIGSIQMYYYGFRYYDPVTGRWPSRDPIGEEGGLNVYVIVGNSPVVEIDYLGLFIPGEYFPNLLQREWTFTQDQTFHQTVDLYRVEVRCACIYGEYIWYDRGMDELYKEDVVTMDRAVRRQQSYRETEESAAAFLLWKFRENQAKTNPLLPVPPQPLRVLEADPFEVREPYTTRNVMYDPLENRQLPDCDGDNVGVLDYRYYIDNVRDDWSGWEGQTREEWWENYKSGI